MTDKDRADHDVRGQSGFSRRELMAGGTLAGLGALTAGGATTLTGCNAPAPAPAAGPGAVPSFELDEVPLAELIDAMAEGRYSARRLTELFLERIEAIDHQGPTLRAVIETNPAALEAADTLDAERAAGSVRGPLHGVPILLKDNVATVDPTETTAGSLALEGARPSADAFLAGKLRAAGAVILGKANLSEWANFRSEHSSSGWSGRGGQCRNPYALDRNPCGSSSGSGAAVSASLAAAAIGTETNGSIVCPSSANGVVGIKPTVGLVSRSGIIPISSTQDTAGPMARTVRDAAILLGALVGSDAADPATAEADAQGEKDYTAFLDTGGLRGKRIGVGREFLGFDPRVDALFEEALQALRDGGAELVDPVEIATRSAMGAPSYELMLYEFKAGIADYLASLGDATTMHSLTDLIAFNQANADREMPYFGQEVFLAAEEKGPLTDKAYQDARAKALRLARDEGIDRTMDDNNLDAIIAPTGGPAWLTDLVNGDHFSGGSSSPAAVAGYPNVSLPMGSIRGLPVGLSFFGRAWSEPTLLEITYAFEQATQHRQRPKFLPSLGLA